MPQFKLQGQGIPGPYSLAPTCEVQGDKRRAVARARGAAEALCVSQGEWAQVSFASSLPVGASEDFMGDN